MCEKWPVRPFATKAKDPRLLDVRDKPVLERLRCGHHLFVGNHQQKIVGTQTRLRGVNVEEVCNELFHVDGLVPKVGRFEIVFEVDAGLVHEHHRVCCHRSAGPREREQRRRAGHEAVDVRVQLIDARQVVVRPQAREEAPTPTCHVQVNRRWRLVLLAFESREQRRPLRHASPDGFDELRAGVVVHIRTEGHVEGQVE